MPETVRVPVADRVRLAADVWLGTGTPFLLLHGLASNRNLWHPVAELLHAAGHHVAAIDLRGHGESEKPTSGYDFASMADDVVGAVCALGMDRPVLVGQSYGGNLVLETAARHRRATRAIAAVDGAILDLHARWPAWAGCLQAMSPPDLDLTFDELRSAIARGTKGWPAGSVEALLACYQRGPEGEASARLSRERHLAILRSMWEQRPAEVFAGLRVPALLLPCDTGDDAWTAHKLEAVAAAERASERVRVSWFTAAHDVHLQHPDQVADALLRAHHEGFFG